MLVACAYANGYDPARYSVPEPAVVNPEIEPLPPSEKRRIRDPRGSIVVLVDAGALVASDASAIAVAPAAGSLVPPTCGAKTDPCPLQHVMHVTMETAHTPGTLTAAFTHIATMSPDPTWEWSSIATRGAELAAEGNVAAAKAQCAACHDAYRAAYRTSYRARGL